MAVAGTIRFPEISTPDTPSANNHRVYVGTDGALKKVDDAGSVVSYEAISTTLRTRSIQYTIDGGGAAITTGAKGFVIMPYSGTITEWTLIADVSGSIVIDVWKDTYANHPPTVADTIAGSEKPTLSSATKNQDTTLSTWSTAVTAGDIIRFNVDSVSTVTLVVLSIKMTVT